MLRWGLIGFGRAGSARARAIQACDRSELVAGHRGGVERFGLEPSPSAEAVFGAVDAVAICTPDDTHADLVDAALSAGCHVVCEYPLAVTRARAEGLFVRASKGERVLHVEHIELLAGTQGALRERVGDAALLGGTIHDSDHTDGARPPVIGSLARLHRLVDLFGLPDRISTEGLHYGDARVGIELRMIPDPVGRDRWLRLRTRAGVFEVRNRRLTYDGVPVPVERRAGLFAQDHAVAVARILSGAAPYVTEERILRVLGVVDALRSHGEGSTHPPSLPA